MFSRIVVSAGTRPSPQNDGELEVHEILHLRVRSPLVVPDTRFLRETQLAAPSAALECCSFV